MATRADIKSMLSLFLRAGLKAHSITLDDLDESVDAFYASLNDLTPEILQAASQHYLSSATWFPTPGQIRDKAMELQLLALGVPTAAEAWAQVLGAGQYANAEHCSRGIQLREHIEAADSYWRAVSEYDQHVKACPNCNEGGYREVYAHSAVRETVRLLGGRARLMTDNAAADRARFIEAYKDVVRRERTLAGMPEQVREFVDSRKAELIGQTLSALTEKVGAK